MKKIKTFTVAFLLFLSCLLFAGCSAAEYAVIHYSDGSIEHIFAVLVDEEILTESGLSAANASAVKFSIKSRMTNFRQEMTAAYRNRVDELEIEDDEKIELKNALESQVKENENILSLNFLFKNSTAYSYFAEVAPFANKTGDPIEEKGFFLTKVCTVLTTFYGQNSDSENPSSPTVAQYFYEEYKNLILSYGNAAVWDNLQLKQPLTFNFTYVTTSPRVHSDATEIYAIAGGYLHTWNLNKDTDGIVHLYSYRINAIAWYGLALLLTLLLLTILFTVASVQKIKNSRKLSINLEG